MKNTGFCCCCCFFTLHALFQRQSGTYQRHSQALIVRLPVSCPPTLWPTPWPTMPPLETDIYPLMGGRAVVPAVEDAERSRRCTAAISSVLRFSTFCWCSLRISRSFTRWTSFCMSRWKQAQHRHLTLHWQVPWWCDTVDLRDVW